jgi:hypothetical protein
MSIAVASWKVKDARTEILSLVDQVRDKEFNIDKDYILRAFLFLYHKDVKFKITSFKNDFIERIEIDWDKIRDAILSLFNLLKSYGLNGYTLTSNIATLPVLYYIYHSNKYKDFDTLARYRDDRSIIKRWLFTVLVRRTFGGQTDTVLSQARRTFTTDIEKTKIGLLPEFPSVGINKEIKKITEVGEDFIEELLWTPKGSQYSFPILALLYPDLDYKNNNFHQDHLHPEAHYDKLSQRNKDEYGWEVYNSILNLQMLDSNENMSKQDLALKKWVEKETKNSDLKRFLDAHLIPTKVGLELTDFEAFIEERKPLLIKKLKSLLS